MKLLILVSTLVHLIIIEGQLIHVYLDHSKQGRKEEVSISKCSNLPDGMAGEVTSIDTRDNCARFYDGWNCTGDSIEVMPRSPSHNYLGDWNFNDKILSVGPCRNECSSEITGHDPGEVGEPVEVTLFNRKDLKGAYETITIRGCTLIPTKFIRQLLSVKMNSKCIQIYNNIKCHHKGQGVDSIELRQGTPHHQDISRWWVPEARAISHCSHKCNKPRDLDVTVQETVIDPKDGEVVLFDAKRFQGNFIRILLKSCVNLTDPWEGSVVSLKTFNKTCISLFDRRGCEGDFLNVISSHHDLSQRQFEDVTRSLKPCNPVSQVSRERESASDFHGEANAPSSSSISPSVIAAIVVVPMLGVLTSVLLVIFIMRKCHPYKKIMDMLSDKEIQEFLYGLGLEINDNPAAGSSGAGDYSVELLAQNRPYNNTYEVLRSNIKFDSKAPLGMGEFGVVYKGTLTIQNEDNKGTDSDAGKVIKNITVAVKTVRPDSNIQCLRSLLKEVKVMLYVGSHSNVVQLVGCCTENLRTKGEILVLVEFCSNGSLEEFLQKSRENFCNVVTKGKIDAKEFQKQSSASAAMHMRRDYQNCGSISNFNIFQLIQWSIEIACGMEFLASLKIIHSDLAARNILLDEKCVAKISDFGLSKQLYCYTEYVKKRQEPLPWRWLALESLKDMEFSTKSDVWSYGILSWEIFTLGEKPYPGVVWSNDFIRNLEDGLRLRKPRYATTDCYNLMIRCWDENPKCRPDFTEIREELEEILDSAKADSLSARPNSQANLIYV